MVKNKELKDQEKEKGKKRVEEISQVLKKNCY